MYVKMTLQTDNGGYDLRFVDAVPDRLVCTICTKVFRDPHLTGCCGQHYCESCISCWLRQHGANTCPHCRRKYFPHSPAQALKREINSLKVSCVNRAEGCMWDGELGRLQTHLDKACDYVEIPCTNKCYWPFVTKVKRKDLNDHLANSCHLRRYTCEYCGFQDTHQAITRIGGPLPLRILKSHYEVCPEYPLDCPNRCGATGIHRKHLPSHRQQCPLEPMECPNGCNQTPWLERLWPFAAGPAGAKRINREDLGEHLRSECHLRKYTCEHCGHRDTYQAITGKGGPETVSHYHYAACPDMPLRCPNACGSEGIKRKNMAAHRKRCPLEPMQCPFQQAGCKDKLVRRDFDSHMSSQVQEHLLLTFRTVCTLQKRCSELEKENARLRAEYQGKRR